MDRGRADCSGGVFCQRSAGWSQPQKGSPVAAARGKNSGLMSATPSYLKNEDNTRIGIAGKRNTTQKIVDFSDAA